MKTHRTIGEPRSLRDRIEDAADNFFAWLDRPGKLAIIIVLAVFLADCLWRR